MSRPGGEIGLGLALGLLAITLSQLPRGASSLPPPALSGSYVYEEWDLDYESTGPGGVVFKEAELVGPVRHRFIREDTNWVDVVERSDPRSDEHIGRVTKGGPDRSVAPFEFALYEARRTLDEAAAAPVGKVACGNARCTRFVIEEVVDRSRTPYRSFSSIPLTETANRITTTIDVSDDGSVYGTSVRVNEMVVYRLEVLCSSRDTDRSCSES